MSFNAERTLSSVYSGILLNNKKYSNWRDKEHLIITGKRGGKIMVLMWENARVARLEGGHLAHVWMWSGLPYGQNMDKNSEVNDVLQTYSVENRTRPYSL